MKTVTHIPNVPKSCISDNDFDSHREALYLALSKTAGSVVEFGAGDGSTRMIEKYCRMNNRSFLSYETNKEWAEKYPDTTTLVPNYLSLPIFRPNTLDLMVGIGLAFIDAAPAEIRKDLIDIHKDNANVLIIHDTESGAEYVYGMSEVLSPFKYRLNYAPVGKPHTALVSNYIDVSQWV